MLTKTQKILQRLLSYNRPLNLLISGRGPGKTTEAQRLVFNRAAKFGEKFLWLTLLDLQAESTASGKGGEFITHHARRTLEKIGERVTIAGGNFYNTEKKIIGKLLPLFRADDLKSKEMREYKYIIVEEAIPTNARMRFVNYDIGKSLASLFETVARLRNNVRVIMLANTENPSADILKRLGFLKLHKGLNLNAAAAAYWIDIEHELPEFYAAKQRSNSGKVAKLFGLQEKEFGAEFEGAAGVRLTKLTFKQMYEQMKYGLFALYCEDITAVVYRAPVSCVYYIPARDAIDLPRSIKRYAFDLSDSPAGYVRPPKEIKEEITRLATSEKTRYETEFLQKWLKAQA